MFYLLLDMNVLYILIIISLLIALLFLGVFIYSVKKGQYDDDYTPSVRMLFDDELISEKKENTVPETKIES